MLVSATKRILVELYEIKIFIGPKWLHMAILYSSIYQEEMLASDFGQLEIRAVREGFLEEEALELRVS